MKATQHAQPLENSANNAREENSIERMISESWNLIAPFWPLKNLIAVNPLQGLEEVPFEHALSQAVSFFEWENIPSPMEKVNTETIKWLQAYCDEGQATIPMPNREMGLFHAWRILALHDKRLHANSAENKKWLANLPQEPTQIIGECLLKLNISHTSRTLFLTLLLTTLPGWAAHIKYITEWAGIDKPEQYQVSKEDYLAMRLVLCCLLYPKASELLVWHRAACLKSALRESPANRIYEQEKNYRMPLLQQIAMQNTSQNLRSKAQLIFCIDVRSEPMRRAIEKSGRYETFGFAGFFGIPLRITDTLTKQSYSSCPVLLPAQHEIAESSCCEHKTQRDYHGHHFMRNCQHLYQSNKYSFTTPFVLAEALGLMSGVWMLAKTLFPRTALAKAERIRENIRPSIEVQPALDSISFSQQCDYAENALKMIGLTQNFAPIVVFCGHGSTTQNNAYATALDCGACGGHHGATNARVIAAILNRTEIRKHLATKNIHIPADTCFIAAEHNTTTDNIALFPDAGSRNILKLELLELKADLLTAQDLSNTARQKKLSVKTTSNPTSSLTKRSLDWAEIQPEWGLAGNAAFIVGPRTITHSLELEGRCFLHSYDYKQDPTGKSLATILTAPMVVAQWINSQYLFSTLNNVSYGSGSKITHNITGKLGIMQGNASDLMTGLPLQSVNSTYNTRYHEAQRLMTVVYAPRDKIMPIIETQPVLQKLFSNGWVSLACIEPESREIFMLGRNLVWQ